MEKHNYGCNYSMPFHKVDVSDSELLSKFRCEYKAISDFIRNKSIESKKMCHMFLWMMRTTQLWASVQFVVPGYLLQIQIMREKNT